MVSYEKNPVNNRVLIRQCEALLTLASDSTQQNANANSN